MREGTREALSGLTVRGRAFLGAGIAAIVCGTVIDQRTLLRIGVLAVVLPLLSAWVIGRGRYRLTLARSISSATVPAGSTVRVELRMTNDGVLPTGSLLVEEMLPFQLGVRPRFVVGSIRRSWSHAVDYVVRSDVRGRFEIGPLTAQVSDAFGLVRLPRTFSSTSTLVVTPRIEELTAIPLPGGHSTSGDAAPRAYASGSAEDVTVREYRRGDELRRVHWRSSARLGELMVRREEQPWQASATVLLDDRAAAHAGSGASSSFELAVSAAASLVEHLERRGYVVRLATCGGAVCGVGSDRRDAVATMMKALAEVGPVSDGRLHPGALAESTSGLTVAVLARIADADLAALDRIRQQSGAALALELDLSAWGVAAQDGTDALGRHGWRAAVLTPRERLDDAWRRLATAGAAR